MKKISQLQVVFFICLLSMVSCKSSSQNSEPKAIIGVNNLIEATGKNLEAKHGFIQVEDRKCNSFLTSSNRVTTTLHCIGKNPSSYVGLKYRSFAGKEANIVEVMYLDDTKDMVSYELDKHFISFYRSANLDLRKPLKVVGIDHQTSKIMENSCRVENLLPKKAAFEYKCDTTNKFSGSPIIQEGNVVGMHIGYNSVKKVNYALNFDQLLDDKSDIVSLELEVGVQLEWGPHVRVKQPHVRITSPHIRTPDNPLLGAACGSAVAGTVGGGAVCGSCIAGASGTYGAIAAACAAPCGTSAASLGTALSSCK